VAVKQAKERSLEVLDELCLALPELARPLRRAGGEIDTDTNARHWRRLRATAIASIVLWTATLVAGVVLTNAA